MLTEQDFIKIEKQAISIYNNLELKIIEEIATRISNFGYANTVVINDLKIAEEMGFLYQDIVKLVAEYNNTSYEKVNDIFIEAGEKSLKFDDKIYKESGLNPTPLKQDESIKQVMNATIERTSRNLQNLCMTTAATSQTQFINAINNAYLYTSTGVKSYSQAIIDEIENISSQGVMIEYPSGVRRSIESAVRMNIITAVNQNCGKLQEMRADEMGWDLMELTAHGGARPSHAEWQGKIVSRSGKKGYLSLDSIGYGTATGFKGINCRHDWYPYYPGSARTYTLEQLNAWKNEKVIYNGQEYSKYDATQIQRRMERQIKKDKKEIAGLQGILTSETKDNKLIENTKLQISSKKLRLKQDNSILNDFVDQTIINKEELHAINLYISSESYKINEALREGQKLTKEQQIIKKNLDNALNLSKTYKGNVVRVLDIKDNKKIEKFIKKNEVGKKVTFKEYLSFSDKNNYNDDANIIIYTTSKNGRDIRRYNPEESEVLYPRNSKFIVESLIKNDNTYYILWRDINE